MTIEIKMSKKPIEYTKSIAYLEQRLNRILYKNGKELIWILEHPDTYTAGVRSKNSEILDKSIKIIKTNRGGKITYHGPGQIICYLVINLNKRKKDIRKFIKILEDSIIKTFDEYNLKTFSDRKNVGIWINHKNKIKKICAIGIKVKKWIAYHGISINVNADLNKYNKIIPCGIASREVTNLKMIKKQNYNNFKIKLIKNLILNLNI